MTSNARRPAQVSSARAAVSTESQPSGIGPSAAVNAECRCVSSVLVLASQLSARYQATGMSVDAAKPASSVLLPEPAGATTRPTRYWPIRARRASMRSRARECICGISTLADTTAEDPSLTLASPQSSRCCRARFAEAPPAFNPYTPCCLRRSPSLTVSTSPQYMEIPDCQYCRRKTHECSGQSVFSKQRLVGEDSYAPQQSIGVKPARRYRTMAASW